MSTTTKPTRKTEPAIEPPWMVLHDIPWDLYVRLREIHANRNIRMTYHNGTLELMSPQFRHEVNAVRFGSLVLAVTGVLGIPCTQSRTLTLQRKGKGPKKGTGKEPDTSFYIANEHRMRGKERYDPAIDPPPDLAIEVDDSRDSRSRLPLYAALGVPEVWRYDAVKKSLWFGRLRDDGTYEEIQRSVSLPMLTADRVLDWLKRGENMAESIWFEQLRDWVRDELPPRPEVETQP